MKYVPLVIPNFQKTNVFDLYSKTDVVGKNHNEKKALFRKLVQYFHYVSDYRFRFGKFRKVKSAHSGKYIK